MYMNLFQWFSMYKCTFIYKCTCTMYSRVAKPRGATFRGARGPPRRAAPRKIFVKTPRRKVKNIKIFNQIIINVSKFIIRTS